MKELSIWASKHQRYARWIIGVGLLLVYLMAIPIGFYLENVGVYASKPFFTSIVIAFFIISLLKYPDREHHKRIAKKTSTFFLKWKVYDFTLIICIVLLGFSEGMDLNSKKISDNRTISLVSESITTLPVIQVNHGVKQGNKSNIIKRFVDRVQRKIAHFFTTILKKSKSKKDWLLITSYILYAILFSALIIVIGIFSCSLSCNGYPLYAGLLFFGGQLLVGTLIYFLALWTANSRDRKRGEETDKRKNRKSALIVALIPIVLEILLIAFGDI